MIGRCHHTVGTLLLVVIGTVVTLETVVTVDTSSDSIDSSDSSDKNCFHTKKILIEKIIHFCSCLKHFSSKRNLKKYIIANVFNHTTFGQFFSLSYLKKKKIYISIII